MSSSAQGQVVDAGGTGLQGVTVVLEDVSALFTSTLTRTITDDKGRFSVAYQEDSHSDLGPRRVRLSLCVGRHVIKTQELDDATTAKWQIPILTADRTDATSWWATLNTGAVSRRTDGNALRWLVDDLDAWSALVKKINEAQTSVDLMQLHLDINEFAINPDDENPAIVLAFGSGLSPTEKRKVDATDTRVERLLLAASSKQGMSLRVQIPAMSLDSHALPTAVILAGGLVLLAFLSLLAAVIVLLVLAFLGVCLNRFLRNAVGNPDAVSAWFIAAGKPDAVKAFPAPMASIIHAKIVTIDGAVGFLLGSPFVQGYYDSQAHDLDEPRRGMTAAAEGGPIHDVSALVRGPAVGHLQEVFNQHWNISDPAANLPVPPALPAAVSPDTQNGEVGATVQIVRSLDAGTFASFPDGEKGVLEAYLRAIAFAKRFIYFENQYFTEDTVIDALIDAMVARPDLELILVLNINPDIPWYPPWQRAAIRKINAALGAAATSRFATFTTWSHKAADPPKYPKPRLSWNYVHAKVAIVDNKWATVGSANLDGASLNYFQVMHPLIGGVRNTETNCVVYEDPVPAVSAVDALRRRLWAEHLGVVDAGGAPNPTDGLLDDQPGKKWVVPWSLAATNKLIGLADLPGTPTAPHVLPWALDHTSHTARDYLGHLFRSHNLPMPDLDLVEPGPRAYDFKKGDWAT